MQPPRRLLLLAGATVFLGAFLLFCMQLMVAKMVLPFLGGAATVWTTAVLFFQSALCAAYLYADRLARIRDLRRQFIVHLVLMSSAALLLPVGFAGRTQPAPHESPIAWELIALLQTVGLPFFFVAVMSPLVQNWFSRTDEPAARDPYFLYAASNAGSLLALMAYPFIIEPLLGLSDQSRWWSIGYVSLIVLVATAAAALRPLASEAGLAMDEAAVSRPAAKTRLFWLTAAFVPSVLLLGVTAHISVNLAPVPLVWIIPLAVYLVTFICAFGRKVRVSHRFVSRLAPVVFVVFCPVLALEAPPARFVVLLVGVHLYLLFIGGLICHTALAASRPHTRDLTQYYVWISLGGAVGGVFAAVIAPVLFTRILEYPLFLAISALFRGPGRRGGWFTTGAVAAVVLAVALFLPRYLAEPDRQTVHVARNFFGVKRIVDRGDGTRWFVHGDTLHGVESKNRPGEPLAYYHRDGPIGEVMSRLAVVPNQHIGVLGLGAGSLAAYAGPQRRVTFLEIDPAVEVIARTFFTYLSRCGQQCEVLIGDGRLSLSRFPDREFDLLVLDAFSSDTVPPHVISKEALRLYLTKLKPDGAILFHVSNRYLHVKDLISALVIDTQLAAFVRSDAAVPERYKMASQYVIAGARLDSSPALRVAADPQWQRASRPRGVAVWTDDYSNMIALLRWRPPAD
jgi:hypothetical protein